MPATGGSGTRDNSPDDQKVYGCDVRLRQKTPDSDESGELPALGRLNGRVLLILFLFCGRKQLVLSEVHKML